jgi:hypothetical protein
MEKKPFQKLSAILDRIEKYQEWKHPIVLLKSHYYKLSRLLI